jgi:hypothetical protein
MIMEDSLQQKWKWPWLILSRYPSINHENPVTHQYGSCGNECNLYLGGALFELACTHYPGTSCRGCPQFRQENACILLQRVRGSVTNNNGFWFGWLDLLTPSNKIILNYNQLQQLTINDCLRLVPFLTGLRVSSLPLWLTWFWFTNRSLQPPVSAGLHSWTLNSTELLNSYECRMPNAEWRMKKWIRIWVWVLCYDRRPVGQSGLV